MSDLTTSRINRLIRPLRLKSASFVASTKTGSRPTFVITYSRRAAIAWNGAGSTTESPETLRAIYSVRDAFKTAIQVAFGVQHGLANTLSLAALCAGIVGNSMSEERDEKTSLDEEETGKEEDMTQVIDSLYEAVPLHYRRWTLASHAVSIVLETCPNHPVLLTGLLEACIPHGLMSECIRILRAIFETALVPHNHPTVPAAYLVQVCAIWRSHSNDQALARILSDTFLESSTLASWRGRGIARLVQDIRTRDTIAFMTLASTFAECATTQQWDGHELLAAWILPVVDRLSDARGEEMEAVVAFLDQARLLAGDGLESAISHIVTQLLAAGGDNTVLSRVLSSSSPKPTTFNSLVARFLVGATCDSVMERVESYAALLRENSLLRLEASLWVCTLTSVGKSTSLSGDVKALELRLIQAVESAERRCFGGCSAGVTKKRGREEPAQETEWRWEEFVESWVQRTPLVKKPRMDLAKKNCLPHIHTRRKLYSPASRRSSASSVVVPSPDSDNDEHVGEKENSPSKPRRLVRRKSNFSSLLADAERRRTVLHPPGRPNIPTHVSRGGGGGGSSKPNALPPCTPAPIPRQKPQVLKTPYTPLRSSGLVHLYKEGIQTPMSDDLLDLFACSSPVM